ncbi:MAG: hypothetical protein GX260_07115 [Tissierellia bacterium]|jgi:DNA repair exonuclease SbcCD ATPase subunit|nr:hypothetical protein [Bacillota bacterium]NLL23523.1 hypothetical protein [Tissierellia bacterium]
MSLIREKYNYLQGLAEGLEIGSTSKEGKLLMGILELLDEITLNLEELEEYVEDIDETILDLDEEIAELQDEAFGMNDDLFHSFNNGYDYGLDDEDYVDEEMLDYDEFEIYCPSCGAFIPYEAEDEVIVCPECAQVIEILEEDEEDEDVEEIQED